MQEESAQPIQSIALKPLENLRKRLLDLTARNRLINFRHTKRGSLRIVDELPNQLVETLLANTVMRFQAIPEPTEEDLIATGHLKFDEMQQKIVRLRKDPSADEWARHLGFATNYEVPEITTEDKPGKHTDKFIQTLLYPYEMEAMLKSLLRNSESAIQEMGANILYLAFGFLEWFDYNNSDSARIAPLFLVPVRLHKGRLNIKTRTYDFTLNYSGEDIIPNLSLREKLKVDFGMVLPDLDENTVPEDYFSEVQEMIDKNQQRWRVRRYITLALLNFGKLLMYLDLNPERWPIESNITDHPVVKRFLVGYEKDTDVDECSIGDLGFGEEYLIDDLDDVHTKYPLIDDADSSQHSALIDAVDGKNLVIEGPPGTGKSQTITNLIAASMARGKSVLFVAEKLAALEVVRSRLDAAGLGEFCLELHSHKSQKSKVLEEIKVRLKKHGRYRKPKDIDVDIARYEELKEGLKAYAEKINRPWKNTGKTLHEILMAATRYRNAIEINPKDFHPDGYDGNRYDAAAQRRNEDRVKAYRKRYEILARQMEGNVILNEHPWYGVKNADIQFFDIDRVIESLDAWQKSLQHLISQIKDIANMLDCGSPVVPGTFHDTEILLDELKNIPALKGNEILERLPVLRGEVLKIAYYGLEMFEKIQELYTTLLKTMGPDILRDLTVVDRLLPGSKKLQQFVGHRVCFQELATALNHLSLAQDRLVELREPLEGVVTALGESAAKHLNLSESGLSEFKTVIELISSLNPSYWKQRDELFDNDELDELLPQLRIEIQQLIKLRDDVQGVYNVETVPDEGEIRQLETKIAAGGIFCWFKGSWRSARKQLLGYAASAQVKYKNLVPLIDNYARYSNTLTKINNNPRYRESLGDRVKGPDTNLEALESLRAWYKSVRLQFGVGFGPKVPLGDAILGLSHNVARAVRSVSERGVQKQINNLLEELASLKKVFSPVTELRTAGAPLDGKTGTIQRILSEVNKAIVACSPLSNDDSLTVGELAERMHQLDWLKNLEDRWIQSDFDRKIFQGRLGLKTGINAKNDDGLAMLHNSLALAAHVDRELRNEVLVDYIYNNPTAETFATLESLAQRLQANLKLQQESFEEFKTIASLDRPEWTIHSSDRIDGLISRNQLALDNSEAFQYWLDYVRDREGMEAIGLGRLADGAELGEFQIEHILNIYQASIFDLLSREIFLEDPELGRFSGRSQEALQEQFKEYDIKIKQLQCEQIAWKIDQTEIPRGSMGARVSEHTERVLLEHECNKKTRHIPIRQLLKRASNALVAMKPCFMMGPMSVAHYLEPGKILFDLVVMDEASQIKPQDALGAVARGKQLIVVGDPKQLPPTSFFDRIIEDDEEDPTAIEESESILDATLPMFSVRRLRWHYRSQHERLIAFSNHNFYDSDLVLFPSPNNQTEKYGIQYYRVPRGCFINRRNMEEAKTISQAVREHFRVRPKETLGVVAMSAEQRLQIERAIETLAKDDPLFQEWLDIDESRKESLFIKNLENVQGDERDVIFISMTYGPQEPKGKVFQRFGPINSDVGWRRLNVLFTRSKKRMHIFSSMGSEDIITGSKSKRGVQALRDFLSFCETGILHKTVQETERGPDSDFEIAVINALRDKGFDCIPQVGVAGFFIDVAVIDPGHTGRYLMGIECDGATYHSAKSARDRDRLRQTILEGLGWNIRRIWSTDWYKNPHGELRPLIEELHQLKTAATFDDEKVKIETKKVEVIVEEVNADTSHSDILAFEDGSLQEKLLQLDRKVIRKDLPDTPENSRLLRPAMIEALLEYTPTCRTEFLESIPYYIRQATAAEEGKYLEQVFSIINVSLENV